MVHSIWSGVPVLVMTLVNFPACGLSIGGTLQMTKTENNDAVNHIVSTIKHNHQLRQKHDERWMENWNMYLRILFGDSVFCPREQTKYKQFIRRNELRIN